MTMIRLAAELNRFFTERGMDPAAVAVVFRCDSLQTQDRILSCLHREFQDQAWLVAPPAMEDFEKFQCYGVQFEVRT
jgi:hypothetical protein